MKQAVELYCGLKDALSKTIFLQNFRKGLLEVRSEGYVNKIMTTMNQCCRNGMKLKFADPSINKAAQKPSTSGKGANEKHDSECAGTADDEAEDSSGGKTAIVELKKKRPRPNLKLKARPPTKRKKTVIEVVSIPDDVDDSAPAIGMSASFKSSDSLLALKAARSACVTLDFIDRLFELFNSGNLQWNNGNNICVSLLMTLGNYHDKVLCFNERQPCGSVVEEFKKAISEFTEYENEKAWIVSNDAKLHADHLKLHEEQMNSEQRWAISAPQVQGAVGLVLWALVAYFPALCFTNVSHHDEKKSEEIRNNRAMAMLPSKYSVAMFSQLAESGYINKADYPEEFWETSAVCLSSNDSALDVSCVKKAFKERNFRVFSDQDQDCFHFEDPPPLWGLHSDQSWVKISSCMWGEIGQKR